MWRINTYILLYEGIGREWYIIYMISYPILIQVCPFSSICIYIYVCICLYIHGLVRLRFNSTIWYRQHNILYCEYWVVVFVFRCMWISNRHVVADMSEWFFSSPLFSIQSFAMLRYSLSLSAMRRTFNFFCLHFIKYISLALPYSSVFFSALLSLSRISNLESCLILFLLLLFILQFTIYKYKYIIL